MILYIARRDFELETEARARDLGDRLKELESADERNVMNRRRQREDTLNLLMKSYRPAATEQTVDARRSWRLLITCIDGKLD